MDYVTIVRTIIEPLVDHPQALLIREIPNENKNRTTVVVVAENNDTARLIGRRGMIANALREVVAIAGKQDGVRLFLKFETFTDNDEASEV